MPATNPFDTPRPVAANPWLAAPYGGEAWPVNTPPAVWETPVAPAPTFTSAEIPQDAAVDQGTGEYIVNKDGKPQTRTQLLAAWEASKLVLAAAKEVERALRDEVVACYSDPDKKSGTQRVPLLNGFELKMGKTQSYKFVSNEANVTMIDAVQARLKRIAESQIEGAQTFVQGLVKWDATLLLTTYKVLPPELKSIIDEVIVTDDGAPTVEIIPPKDAT